MTNKAIIDDIIRAASITQKDGATKPGVFCLGPFAKRVSFVSQQHRALNLIWALNVRGLVKSEQSIAVVGAGLAGVTAASALIAMQCKVTLFDSRNGIMARQRGTHHRIVHPSINLWPMEELNPTTEFPFFDWYGARCNEIAQTIEASWERISTRENEAFGERVAKIDPRRRGGVKLITEKGAEIDFDAVIVAIGFGAETAHEGFRSIDYWDDDLYEARRNDAPGSTFIISGCGDGGLIDTLRLVHFKFNGGQLTLDVARALTGTGIARSIAKAELSLQRTVETLRMCYEQCAAELVEDPQYKSVHQQLSQSLDRSKTRVRLVDKVLSAPFSFGAAPIHKLMVAHAMELDRVLFTPKHEIQRAPDDSITVEDDSFESDTPVIIRHGAAAKFEKLLTVPEQSSLADNQAKLAEQQAGALWKKWDLPVPPGFPVVDRTSPEFIADRLPLAVDALGLHNRGAQVMEGDGVFEIRYLNDAPLVPTKLFGVPTATDPADHEVFR